MTVTIDKAGRLVIPVEIRTRLGLTPGSALKLKVEGHSLRLERDVPGPELVREGKVWVVRPRVSRDRLPPVDLTALIEEESARWPLPQTVYSSIPASRSKG